MKRRIEIKPDEITVFAYGRGRKPKSEISFSKTSGDGAGYVIRCSETSPDNSLVWFGATDEQLKANYGWGKYYIPSTDEKGNVLRGRENIAGFLNHVDKTLFPEPRPSREEYLPLLREALKQWEVLWGEPCATEYLNTIEKEAS